MFKRQLEIKIPPKQSIFLWGARQTGKTSYLKSKYEHSIFYNLLDTREFIRLSQAPYLIREEILAASPEQLKYPVIIDEIQKVPMLLNEVHLLIEEHGIQFILCGSSARQLKATSVNLLGGRAWPFYFYPLIYPEIPDFDLYRALTQGLIPKHYLSNSENIRDYFNAYVSTYLTDEIKNEGLVRNLMGFAAFLEVAAMNNGEMINFTNIARDCGVNRQSVQGYYQILVDTLLGYFVHPYAQKVKRDLIEATPKFYFFDLGVTNYLAHQAIIELKGAAAGRAFEHYIFMELMAYKGLTRQPFEITYWRTRLGLEVDFILGKALVAIEVKISMQVHQEDLKGLIAFCEEHQEARAYVVSQDHKPRDLKVNEQLTIHILPWKIFLQKLWAGEIA